MRILVVGANGNMGRRYCAILNTLDISFHTKDVNHDSTENYSEYDGVIYATPTENHIYDIEYHSKNSRAPVLVEKPIGKCDFIIPESMKIMMINQYAHFKRGTLGLTSYNFFKTGSDGIEWDCINIIGLANGPVELRNTSPVWQCQINGMMVPIQDMDRAYIANIIHFIKAIETQSTFDWAAEKAYIYEAHRKIIELIEKGNYAN